MKMIYAGSDEGVLEFQIPDEIAKAGVEAAWGWLIFHEGWSLWSTPALVSFTSKKILPDGSVEIKIAGFLYLAPEHQGAHRFDPFFIGNFTIEEINEIEKERAQYDETLNLDLYSQEWHQANADWLRAKFGLPPEILPKLPGLRK